MDITDVDNHLVPEFVQTVQNICCPLFSQLGANYFDFARFYEDGSALILTNSPNWVKSFILHPDYHAPQRAKVIPGASLWQSYIPEHFLKLGSQEFDHLHGYTYVEHHRDYNQIVNFAAPPANNAILNTYLNERLLFIRFMRYFEHHAAGMISEGSRHRLHLPQATPPADIAASIQELYATFHTPESYYIETIRGSLAITKREAQCISLLLQGCSAQGIADGLFISRRTVETHLETLRQKTHTQSTLSMLCKIRNWEEIAQWSFPR